MHHFFVFRGARAGHGEAVRPADFDGASDGAGNLKNGIFFMKLAAGEFIRLHDGDDLFDAGDGLEVFRVDFFFFADDADDGSELAAGEVRL